MGARPASKDAAAVVRQQRQAGTLVDVLTDPGSNRHPLSTREEATPA